MGIAVPVNVQPNEYEERRQRPEADHVRIDVFRGWAVHEVLQSSSSAALGIGRT